MNNLIFNYEDSLIKKDEFKDIFKEINKEINNMKNALKKGYEDSRASLSLLDDKDLLINTKKIVDLKKKYNPKYIIVVGIGGSNLGTIAIQEAIYGKLYNQKNENCKILYADTVDPDLLYDIIKIIEPALKNDENIIVNGVSKSGGTTETIANFEIIIDVLKKYKKDYYNYVVVTSAKNSKYWKLAEEKGFNLLEIPNNVGGRYSVFSPVGLFPLGLIGINIDKLISGAKNMRELCLNEDIINNPAALSASIIFYNYKKGINIHDTFLFSTDFESIGKWYRQLMGESIGKEFNRTDEKVNNGMTPTVSIGSTDLHSMAQLYLGGPYDKFTSFVRVKENKNKVKIPKYKDYSDLVSDIQNIDLSNVMNAIYEGVKKSYKKSKRPYVEILLSSKKPECIAQFLQMKMMEMMFLGFLMNVNPFDQPNVESYKIETKKILSKYD